ncbi:MAG: sodium:panthothenate symporter [Planctomycetes bacterium]|nr:sodium:panthothenate symporter [Planctomycetota bacterium]
MHLVDWLIVCVPLLIVIVIGLKAQGYVKGVADFLSAGRVAGRYVLCVAGAEANMGLISLVALWESYYSSGFAYNYWNSIATPISICLALTGYCIYRFRETRAMTMGQFLEMRYSKSFRVFAAILQSISGIINYALFPAVGARFIVYYCDLPVIMSVGGFEFQTFGLIMLAFLSVAVFIVMLGGQVTTMVTDCVQGLLSYPMYLIVVGYIIYRFSWSGEMGPALMDRPPGKSMLNPFDIHHLRDFNLFFVLSGIFANIINRLSWQGAQAYNTAAATPHEQKMGQVLGAWRAGFSNMMYVLLAVSAYMFLNHGNFAPQAAQVRSELAVKAMADVTAQDSRFDGVREEISQYVTTGHMSRELATRVENVRAQRAAEKAAAPSKSNRPVKKIDPPQPLKSEASESFLPIAKDALSSVDKGKAQVFGTIFTQMRVPIALRTILPIGITGILCALGIFLLVSTDTTYLHSWGSIVVQDFVLPLRKKPFTPRQQLNLLRAVICFVAVFAFFFSYFFGQIDYILMFFAITGAIWLGGAGSCIVGGLYWKRGTTAGAFSALIVGSSIAFGGMLLQNYWVSSIYPWLVSSGYLDGVCHVVEGISDPFRPYVDWYVEGDKFPINSQELYFIAVVLSVMTYVVVSLLTCREPFNMDRMLHRGKYRVEGKQIEKMVWTPTNVFKKLIGINNEYTKGDRILAYSVFIWSFGYAFGVCFVGTLIWNSISPWPAEWWSTWFFIQNLIVPSIIGIVSTVWFTIGGTIDLKRLFKRLGESERNVLDDGRVIGHVSSGDKAALVDEQATTADKLVNEEPQPQAPADGKQ